MSETDFIVDFIRKVINEEKPAAPGAKPKSNPDEKIKKKKRGKKHGRGEVIVGYGPGKGAGGRFLGSVNSAGALAKTDPKLLMQNLNVKSGGSGLGGAEKILKAATSQTDTMNKAFGDVKKIKTGKKEAVVVKPGDINARNGANLLHHVLIGALGAKFLQAPEAIQIQAAGSEIIIHISPYKNSWEG